MGDNNFSKGLKTKSIPAGEGVDPLTRRVLASRITMSTTFVINPAAGFSVETMEKNVARMYICWGTPTDRQQEDKLTALKKGGPAIASARVRYSRHHSSAVCVAFKRKDEIADPALQDKPTIRE